MAKMNKVTKTVVLILSHVVCALGGAVLGYIVHEKFAASVAFVDEVALTSRAAFYVDMQRAQGSVKDYKGALLGYLDVLEKNKQRPSVFFTEKAYSIDKTLTFVRLARVAEKEGNQNEASRFSESALTSCADTGWTDCSRETLWAVTAKLDETTVMSPGPNKVRRGGTG
ncbi:MAG: hypothetical protein OEY86_14850, partial [Nitrospira sp.]|nr:hypothetical protein [Nitrospira sp.]